jgi:hypothetical protein
VDNEKYFRFSGDGLSRNAGFCSTNKEDMSFDVKFKSKQNFEPKILVSLALPSKGISESYIGTTKGLPMNADVYIQKC